MGHTFWCIFKPFSAKHPGYRIELSGDRTKSNTDRSILFGNRTRSNSRKIFVNRTKSNVRLSNGRQSNTIEPSFIRIALLLSGMFSSLFQLIKVDYDYFCVSYLVSGVKRCSANKTAFRSIVFDFVRMSSHKIRSSILFDLRTRSNTNRSIRVRSVFCSILFNPIPRENRNVRTRPISNYSPCYSLNYILHSVQLPLLSTVDSR